VVEQTHCTGALALTDVEAIIILFVAAEQLPMAVRSTMAGIFCVLTGV